MLEREQRSATIQVPLEMHCVVRSYARNEQTDESDIDVLVEFDQPVGFEFLDLREELEKLFNRKIDLVSKRGIKDHYLPHIEDDAIYVTP